MQIVSVQKYVKITPQKVRRVVAAIKGLSPTRAVEVLPHMGQDAAQSVQKAIKTALANASSKGISQNEMTVKEIQINEGPKLKRGRAVSRGMWHGYIKRGSHIRVVLETKEPKKEAKKNESQS